MYARTRTHTRGTAVDTCAKRDSYLSAALGNVDHGVRCHLLHSGARPATPFLEHGDDSAARVERRRKRRGSVGAIEPDRQAVTVARNGDDCEVMLEVYAILYRRHVEVKVRVVVARHDVDTARNMFQRVVLRGPLTRRMHEAILSNVV